MANRESTTVDLMLDTTTTGGGGGGGGDGTTTHGSITSTVAATVAQVVTDTLNGGTVSAQSVIIDWMFYIFLVAVLAFVFVTPQIYGSREFYKSCFRTKKKSSSGRTQVSYSKMAPPPTIVFDIIWMLLRICETFAFVFYVYNYRFPLTTDAANKFISIFAMFILLIGLQYIWVKLFWNYHDSTAALLCTVCISVLLVIVAGVLTALYGVIGDKAWWSFGFMLPVFVWLLVALFWNGKIAYCYISGEANCRCHPKKESHREEEVIDVTVQNSTNGEIVVIQETQQKSVHNRHHKQY